MIEIITEHIEMPDLYERRFQKHPKDSNGNKWIVEDAEQKRIVYTGKYEEASLISHNLNKKYYRSKITTP